MADIYFMYVVLMEMLQLLNVFIQQNFPSLKLFKNLHQLCEFGTRYQNSGRLDVSIFNMENQILRIAEENSENSVRRIFDVGICSNFV